MSSEDHTAVIIHLDIDAFYAQVEENVCPEYKTKPLGVYQKTIIVTSNYVARAYGITKCMLTTEAIKLCPHLVLVNGENLEKYRQISQDITKFIQDKYKVPVEKLGFDENFVDITKLVNERLNASKNDETVPENSEGNLSDEDDDFSVNLVDEAVPSSEHLENMSNKRKSRDVELETVENGNKKTRLNSFENDTKMSAHTEAVENNTFQHNNIGDRCEDKGNSLHNVSGHVYKNTMGKCSCGCTTRLIIGSHIAHDIRHELLQTFHLTLSAGISYNKLLSKLVGSQHKPNQQTVIFPNAVLDLMGNIHLKQIPGIGRKMFEKLSNLNMKTVEDLQNASKAFLCKEFDSTTADWLSNISYGRDFAKVKVFSKQSSIGVEDRYYKPITNLTDFTKQCKILLDRLLTLVRKDGRVPKLLKISLRFDHFKYEWKLDSKQCQINASVFSNSDPSTIEHYLLDVIIKLYKELCIKRNSHTVTYINIAVGNFIDIADTKNSILKFCQNKYSTFPKYKELCIKRNSHTVTYINIAVGNFIDIADTQNSILKFCQNKYSAFPNESQNIKTPHSSSDSMCQNKSGDVKVNKDSEIINKSFMSHGNSDNNTCNDNSSSVDNTNANHASTSTSNSNIIHTNTLDIDNIDRDVLNELPDDIREEIEREMKTRNSIGITVRQNQTNKNYRSGDQKKKTAKQLINQRLTFIHQLQFKEKRMFQNQYKYYKNPKVSILDPAYYFAKCFALLSISKISKNHNRILVSPFESNRGMEFYTISYLSFAYTSLSICMEFYTISYLSFAYTSLSILVMAFTFQQCVLFINYPCVGMSDCAAWILTASHSILSILSILVMAFTFQQCVLFINYPCVGMSDCAAWILTASHSILSIILLVTSMSRTKACIGEIIS
ncbi:DNA polymerase eta [Diaphorina citri]|uniref:DNA polymerase eta n=1 Tax=Diaphorina citri TaxID=121845 RepID=A0A3Q0IQ86_DIACI|nr:DNA polymerase eta [Diaphorina citri]